MHPTLSLPAGQIQYAGIAADVHYVQNEVFWLHLHGFVPCYGTFRLIDTPGDFRGFSILVLRIGLDLYEPGGMNDFVVPKVPSIVFNPSDISAVKKLCELLFSSMKERKDRLFGMRDFNGRIEYALGWAD